MLGAAKAIGATPEYALYELSYVNAMMYSCATPTAGDAADGEQADYDESLDANDPGNFKQYDEDEEITVS